MLDSAPIKDLSISPREHEIALAIGHLITRANKLGINDGVTLQGSKKDSLHANKRVVDFAVEIYKVWAALFPQEHRGFMENTKAQLDGERSIKESIKQGGIFSVSYPTRYDRLLGLLMKGVKTQDKRFWKPLILKIPELKISNYA